MAREGDKAVGAIRTEAAKRNAHRTAKEGPRDGNEAHSGVSPLLTGKLEGHGRAIEPPHMDPLHVPPTPRRPCTQTCTTRWFLARPPHMERVRRGKPPSRRASTTCRMPYPRAWTWARYVTARSCTQLEGFGGGRDFTGLGAGVRRRGRGHRAALAVRFTLPD